MTVESVIKLKSGERVIRVVRQFPLVFLFRGLAAFAFIAAPFFFMIPLLALKRWGLAVSGISVVGGLFYVFRLGVIWRWNAFVITNRRVVDIDQRGFFERIVSEAPHEKVQDVSYAVRGFWETLLGYGTLIVQTAGSTTNLELSSVREPKDVQHLITELTAAARSGGDGLGPREGKVNALLEAAAELTDAEARAFLVALQEATLEGGEKSRHLPTAKP